MAEPGTHWPRLLVPQFMQAARVALADNENAAATIAGVKIEAAHGLNKYEKQAA